MANHAISPTSLFSRVWGFVRGGSDTNNEVVEENTNRIVNDYEANQDNATRESDNVSTTKSPSKESEEIQNNKIRTELQNFKPIKSGSTTPKLQESKQARLEKVRSTPIQLKLQPYNIARKPPIRIGSSVPTTPRTKASPFHRIPSDIKSEPKRNIAVTTSTSNLDEIIQLNNEYVSPLVKKKKNNKKKKRKRKPETSQIDKQVTEKRRKLEENENQVLKNLKALSSEIVDMTFTRYTPKEESGTLVPREPTKKLKPKPKPKLIPQVKSKSISPKKYEPSDLEDILAIAEQVAEETEAKSSKKSFSSRSSSKNTVENELKRLKDSMNLKPRAKTQTSAYSSNEMIQTNGNNLSKRRDKSPTSRSLGGNVVKIEPIRKIRQSEPLSISRLDTLRDMAMSVVEDSFSESPELKQEHDENVNSSTISTDKDTYSSPLKSKSKTLNITSKVKPPSVENESEIPKFFETEVESTESPGLDSTHNEDDTEKKQDDLPIEEPKLEAVPDDHLLFVPEEIEDSQLQPTQLQVEQLHETRNNRTYNVMNLHYVISNSPEPIDQPKVTISKKEKAEEPSESKQKQDIPRNRSSEQPISKKHHKINKKKHQVIKTRNSIRILNSEDEDPIENSDSEFEQEMDKAKEISNEQKSAEEFKGKNDSNLQELSEQTYSVVHEDEKSELQEDHNKESNQISLEKDNEAHYTQVLMSSYDLYEKEQIENNIEIISRRRRSSSLLIVDAKEKQDEHEGNINSETQKTDKPQEQSITEETHINETTEENQDNINSSPIKADDNAIELFQDLKTKFPKSFGLIKQIPDISSLSENKEHDVLDKDSTELIGAELAEDSENPPIVDEEHATPKTTSKSTKISKSKSTSAKSKRTKLKSEKLKKTVTFDQIQRQLVSQDRPESQELPICKKCNIQPVDSIDNEICSLCMNPGKRRKSRFANVEIPVDIRIKTDGSPISKSQRLQSNEQGTGVALRTRSKHDYLDSPASNIWPSPKDSIRKK